MGGVFVSYRTVDTGLIAASWFDRFAELFGADQVFWDKESIRAGEDYAVRIAAAMEQVDVLVAVIGPDWLARDDDGGGRLVDRERDWVRREITRALQRGIPVIPVLLGDTPVPVVANLPDGMRGMERHQAERVRHESFGRDMAHLERRLVNAAPVLLVRRLFAPPVPPAPRTLPSALLHAERAVVGFHGRDGEIADLTGWASGPALVSARVLVGPAGQGKTRLAHALCAELTDAGWTTGLVADSSGRDLLARVLVLDLPLLLVADYAETRTDQLQEILAEVVAAENRQAPVRLLLLARSAGGWLDWLGDVGDDRAAAVLAAADVTELGPLVATPEDWTAEFAHAARAFATALSLPLPSVLASAGHDQPESRAALGVHAAALAAVLDVGATEPPRDAINRVLAHERRYWTRTAPLGLDTVHCARLAVLATLFGAEGTDQARRLLLGRAWPGPADRFDAALRWVRQLYPGPRALNPVPPDLLGEELVAQILCDDPDLAVSAVPDVHVDQLTRAFTVLGRVLPRHSCLSAVVVTMLAAAPDTALPAAVAVLGRVPAGRDGLVEPICQVIAAPVTMSVDLLERTVDLLPEYGTVVAHDAVALLEEILRRVQASSQHDGATVARLHTNLAARLLAVRDWERAAAHAKEAVHRYEELGAGRHTVALAAAASNLTAAYSRLGEVEHALRYGRRAVEAHWAAAAAAGLGQRKAGLRAVLNYACALQGAGRTGEARPLLDEAVRLARTQAGQTGADRLELQAVLVELLVGLGLVLRETDLDTARAALDEAVAVLRELEESSPGAHRANLTRALTNLAGLGVLVGDRRAALKAAEEAVALADALRQRFGDRFEGLLGQASHNLAAAREMPG
jgi:tetratricopeptide (TPR) repeat protein